MANDRIYLVNKWTGEKVLIAKALGPCWQTDDESIREFIDSTKFVHQDFVLEYESDEESVSAKIKQDQVFMMDRPTPSNWSMIDSILDHSNDLIESHPELWTVTPEQMAHYAAMPEPSWDHTFDPFTGQPNPKIIPPDWTK